MTHPGQGSGGEVFVRGGPRCARQALRTCASAASFGLHPGVKRAALVVRSSAATVSSSASSSPCSCAWPSSARMHRSAATCGRERARVTHATLAQANKRAPQSTTSKRRRQPWTRAWAPAQVHTRASHLQPELRGELDHGQRQLQRVAQELGRRAVAARRHGRRVAARLARRRHHLDVAQALARQPVLLARAHARQARESGSSELRLVPCAAVF